MGLIDGLMGNASEADPRELNWEYARLLIEGEAIEKAYQVIRDLYLFTSRRLILVDRQGVTGRKLEYHSIPYDRITHFSVETAGTFDRDAELKIWVAGGTLIQKTFNKKLDVYEVQKVLASYVL